ncbi:MAG: hypothetical protein WCC21_03885 [Candidatus Acidiferrales bacterium]
MKAISSKLRVGDWVEVRRKEEILATLDSDGRLEGMPFMPEMFAFCGKRFRVYKRAHKTCDTVFPVRGRRVARAIHLETRCDGGAHDGCQAKCLIFWKEAWLKRVEKNTPGVALETADRSRQESETDAASPCLESTVWDRTRDPDSPGGTPRYTCQATQLPYATSQLEWWDIRQYVEDYISGNVGLWQIICGGAYFLFYAVSGAGIGLGRPIRWSWDRFYPLWRGAPFPRRAGTILEGQPTPTQTLDLQPGEIVRIKPYKEILNTLDARNKNRGLFFDAEEVPYCGGTYRVLQRVNRIINERTGQMREINNPSVMLDSVICRSSYSECRLFCPRSIYAHWREIWLERAAPNSLVAPTESADRVTPGCEPASNSR